MAEELSTYTSRQFGLITAEQAARCGYGRDEIRRLCAAGLWTRLRTAIYLPGKAPDPATDPRGRHVLDIAAALLAVQDPDVVVADISAAVIWGFEWIEGPPLKDVFLVRSGGQARRYPGLVVRRAGVPDSHVRVAPNGMRVLSPARTLVDLARRLPLDFMLGMADDALHRRLTTQPEIDQVTADCARWPGTPAAARKLAHADGRAESVAESLLRAILIEAGFTDFDLQVRIVNDFGTVIARVDIGFVSVPLVLLPDGRIKYSDPDALWKEKLCEDEARELGYEYLRFTWAQLRGSRKAVVARVRSGLARAERRIQLGDVPPGWAQGRTPGTGAAS